MARDVVAERQSQRLEVGAQPPCWCSSHRNGGELDGLVGDQAGVEVVEQVEGVVAQHQGGGRLEAEDREALAGQVGQDAEVALQPVAGRFRRRRRPAPAMPQPTWPGGT